MTPTNTYPSEPHRLPASRLWFGFSAPAFAWATQGLVCVFLSCVYCPSNLPHWERMGEGGVRLVIGLITLALLAVSISAGVISHRLWRSSREIAQNGVRREIVPDPSGGARGTLFAMQGARELTLDEGYSREDFMALGGVLISTVCSVGIVWAGIPLMMLDVCVRAR